tara:strand:- start:233 stop:1036 length:804 start_codon:yes stop_codon:yes gene_type:complete
MNIYDRIYNLLTEGESSGGDAGATGERIGKWAKSEKKRPRKLTKADYEAGSKDPQKAAVRRVGKKIAKRAEKKASDTRKAGLEKRVEYGAHAMDDLVQGIKGGRGGPGTLGPIKRRPESATGSLSQSIKHGKLEKKAGDKARVKARGEYEAGLEKGGVTLKPGSPIAIRAKRSRTQKAADELKGKIRTAKHTAAKSSGAKTDKTTITPEGATRRARIKKVAVDRRNRRKTYGDPKKGYKDSATFGDDMDKEMDGAHSEVFGSPHRKK